MRTPQVGDVVLWHPPTDIPEPPQAAMIIAVADGLPDLHVYLPGGSTAVVFAAEQGTVPGRWEPRD